MLDITYTYRLDVDQSKPWMGYAYWLEGDEPYEFAELYESHAQAERLFPALAQQAKDNVLKYPDPVLC